MLVVHDPLSVERRSVGGASRRQRREHLRHVIATTLSITAVAASLAGWTPGSTTAIVIVVAAVVVGLPHGALDVVIGPAMVSRRKFFGSYIALVAAIVAVWFVAPLLSLGAFLAVSWYHFARGDAAHHRELGSAAFLLGMSTAGTAIGLPLVLHSDTVAPLISDLLLGTATLSPQQVAALGMVLVYPSVTAGLVAGVAAVQARRFVAIIELVTIALLAAVVHPLVSFALYFALWHSPRHLLDQDIAPSAVKPTLLATAATLVLAALVWRLAEPSAQVATQVVFIGLAALTGPHLVVTELLHARHAREWATGSARGSR